jgi:hypothetical protein
MMNFIWKETCLGVLSCNVWVALCLIVEIIKILLITELDPTLSFFYVPIGNAY